MYRPVLNRQRSSSNTSGKLDVAVWSTLRSVRNTARLNETTGSFEDAVTGTPVLGVGEIDQAVVTELGAKREVVHITAQGAGDFHVVSNPFHS